MIRASQLGAVRGVRQVLGSLVVLIYTSGSKKWWLLSTFGMFTGKQRSVA